ncbi:PBECR4 domain-containing protein [Streptococcus suis]|uniref:PBECR4 domain-containing protein n=1 Tax=Streptococcus suis TaxID=1307 RepID=UPI0021C79887|nr:PBECR4 domain-containing protein [Streptococcus suis]
MARFTKEDAKAMSILDVARSLGMEMEQNSNQEWYWVEHDSFKINTRKNRFDWYSRDIHGDVINLVETIKEVDYKQAMHYLRTGEFPQAKMNQPVKEPFNYVLGRFEQPFIEARDYLKEVRGLSDNTINFFGQAGVLAQANKKAPDDYLEPVVVFKSLDKDKQVIGASLQGIVPNKERYEGKGYLKQIAYNSDGLSGMSVDIGTPKRLVFAEAPIDLMSYYEANMDNLSDVRLVAMDGLKAGTVSRYTMELLAELQSKSDYKPDLNKVGEALEKLAQVTTFFQDGKNSDLITLAVDNDKAGRDFIERLQAKGIPVQLDLPPLPEGATKIDWNDHLKSQKAGMVLEDSLPRDNSRLETVPVNIQSSEKIQELLEQVEELGQTAYFWVTEEDLEQPEEIVSQLDNWFSSEKVDATYKSDLFELVAGDYTYMIEFKDGGISLQNMEDYSQYIYNRIEELGDEVVISELESVIHDFNQVKNSITEGMNKELEALTSALTRDTELLDKQTTRNNEKEQNMALEHESENLAQATEPRFELEFSEIGRPEQPITNLDELQNWILQQFNSRYTDEGYFKTYLHVYSLDNKGQEIARQIRFDIGQGQGDFNPSREHIRDYLVDNGYVHLQKAPLETKATLDSPSKLYLVRLNWSENLGDSPNPLEDFSEGELIPYAEFISVLYRRNEYSSDRGYERTSFDIISPDGEVIVSDFRYDTGSEVRTIAEKLEDSELAKIEEANKEPYKLLAAIDKHLEIPANLSLPEAAIDAISTQYGENSPILPEAEEKMLDWLEQRYPPTSEYFLELHRGFGVAGLKSTLTYDTWEQYIADSPLPETELTKEVEQRTERLLQVRTEIKERLQSEFVPDVLQEIRKAPEQAQGQEKNAEGTIGDFPDKQEAAPLPEATKSQPLNDLSPNQTQPQPLLHFSINEERKSIKKRGYHPASDRDLVKLNRYSTSLKEVAQWYLRELSDSTIHYIYKDNEGVNSLQVTFDKDKFIHLTGIFPYKEGYSADKLLIDFANGQGSFDDILLANKGAAFDKLKVLPELPAIIEANSFYFDDLSDVPKLHSLNMDKAIKSGDEDIVLALRTVDGETFPASLMKLRSGLRNQLDNAEEKTILGIYRERDGVIEQLSINDEYVKDEGREFLSILENRQFEPIHDVPTISLQERFTSLLDGVREFGAEHFRGREGEEFTKFFQLYAQAKENIDQTIKLGIGEKLVNLDSSFYKEWIDDRLHETAGISSVDVLSGRITSTEYQQQIERLYQTYLQQVAPKVEQTEIRIDSDADGLTDKEEIGKGQNPLGDSVPDQAIIANDEPSRATSQKEPAEERTVAQMVAELDTKALSIHLKEGVKNYLNSDQYKNFLTAMSKLHHYSPRNLQLLLAQNPDVSVVASFKKWKEDYGRTVNKGEKSLRVWAPVQVVRKDKVSGEPMLDDNGKVIKDTVFKLVPVFDISQTSGKEFPTPVNVLEGKHEDYANLYRAAKQVSSDNGVTISISDTPGTSRGYYSPMENKIVLQKGMSEQQTLKTLFHEMAHSDLHNLDAKATQDFTRSTKELQAESVAYVVACHYGFDTSEYSFGYLANWTEDAATLSDLEAQLAIIQKEANSLIQRLDQSLEKVVSKTLSADKFTERLSQFKDETKTLQSGLDKEPKKNQPSLNLDQQMK